jgi:xanthine/CO dehydrogenase XdhC/CoxF family maturation factor
VERFPDAESVALVDPRQLDPGALAIDRYTAAVVMTHHFHHDLAWLSCLVDSPAPYIGLLGPHRRAERLLAELRRQRRDAIPADAGSRLHAPIGLDIGAEAPVEIALAILGEIRAAFAGRAGGSLRERRSALHDWP